MNIYSRANRSIHIVDDYINIKTLYLLQDIKPDVTVTLFSDNLYNKLHKNDYEDFQTEFPNIKVTFLKTENLSHDRFIVLDYDTENERIYHCGASSKDAGKKITTFEINHQYSSHNSVTKNVIDNFCHGIFFYR